MKTQIKIAAVVLAVLLGAAVYLGLGNKPRAPQTAKETRASVAPPTAPAQTPVEPVLAPRYFFDVHNHQPEEIIALLKRAQDTYDNLPEHLRDGVRMAMVLHGPDVEFFASDNYAAHKELVDLAAGLDAFGLVDLKICLAAARSRGLSAEEFPPFIEIVPYGPGEIDRLESGGYVQL